MRKNQQLYNHKIKWQYLPGIILLNVLVILVLMIHHPSNAYQNSWVTFFFLICGAMLVYGGMGIMVYMIKLLLSSSKNKILTLLCNILAFAFLVFFMSMIIIYAPFIYFLPFIILFYPNYKWYQKSQELSKQEIAIKHQLKGFREYLQTANAYLDKDTFETYLPYAIAFEVEKKWTLNFDDRFLKSYFPQWLTHYNNITLSQAIESFVDCTTIIKPRYKV